MNLTDIKKIHFIGIGGIGISAIARMMILDGKKVSGSDIAESIVSDKLRDLGADIFIGHKEENLQRVDLVVYTTAISLENPELQKAKRLGVEMYSYPEMLGLVSKNKYTIAICGTHGKTTTTAMIGGILSDAGLDPTLVVGSLLKKGESNFVAGKSDYFVVEACEYRRAFLNLSPKIIVVTNIEADHLDYYENLEDIQGAFSEFVAKLADDGILICNAKDDNLAPVIRSAKCKVIDYKNIDLEDLRLKVPGRHNLENAKAAATAALALGVNNETSKKSLENFSGTWRRFEHKGTTKNGAEVYDDYGHHPTEIKATLLGAREFFGSKKIICVFQPHLFSRTKSLMDDLANSFEDADFVVLADIYAAREKDGGDINSKDLEEKIKQSKADVVYLGSFDKIEKFLMENSGAGNVIITMGAGDVYKIGEKLIRI